MKKVPIKKASGLPPSNFGQNTGEIAFATTHPPPQKNNLQHYNQYGFSTNRSTEEAILDLLDKINAAKNSKQHALMISLNIKRAFDLLQYTSIKNSLDNLKYHSNTLETLIDILSNRKVAINTSQDPAAWNQQQGCPQGSCTGSVLWNLVVDEVLRQDWPQGVHLQAFAGLTSSFWSTPGQNRKSQKSGK
ncbi:hypothetical protein AVEN_9942-1 [Araneus ventricosus]|uniref:Reverse transcriptase domain-containing protein n=1 Tax=Araneus ventricosus TaxID=182803 RepID=A0A4Y2QIR7_ARAVE|nr:hypothetical protein AVEN_9942-1 [Araneus ventricosus]